MATGDNRRRIQVADLDIQKVNEALRQLSDWIARLEGRSGGVNLRDSVTIQSDKQSLIDFESSSAGKASICVFGTENATLAFAKGARKENNGEWIATDTVSVIWALDRAGNGTLYVNTGLAIGQAFTPTVSFVVGTGGSVTNHVLDSSTHTISGKTAGHVLQALTATTFGFAALSGLNVTNTAAGNIAATTVQAAINELDTEKVAKAGDTMTGALTVGSTGALDHTALTVRGGTVQAPDALSVTSGLHAGVQLLEPSGQVGCVIGVNSTYGTYIQSRWVTSSQAAEELYLNPLGGAIYAGDSISINASSPLIITHTSGFSLDITRTTNSADSGYVAFRHPRSPKTNVNSDLTGGLLFYGYNNNATPEEIQTSFIYSRITDITDGSEDGDLNFSVMVAGTPTLQLQCLDTGIYVTSNCSALSFTDRTPYPQSKKEAYDAINSVEGKDGKVDHAKLHPSLLVEGKKPKGVDDTSTGPRETELGRNLSMTVSALTEVVKDLIARIDKLEKK